MACITCICYYTPSGPVCYDLDTKTLTQIIADGYGDYVNGDYVIYRIEVLSTAAQFERIMAARRIAGVEHFFEDHDWAAARVLLADEVTDGNILSTDYDLINALLPT